MVEGNWFISDQIPASVLRKMARAQAVHETTGRLIQYVNYAELLRWEVPWVQWLGLPVAFHWSRKTPPYPQEVLDFLLGQTIGQGIRLQYRKLDCYIISADFRPDNLGREITPRDLERMRFLTAVEARFVDLRS